MNIFRAITFVIIFIILISIGNIIYSSGKNVIDRYNQKLKSSQFVNFLWWKPSLHLCRARKDTW